MHLRQQSSFYFERLELGQADLILVTATNSCTTPKLFFLFLVTCIRGLGKKIKKIIQESRPSKASDSDVVSLGRQHRIFLWPGLDKCVRFLSPTAIKSCFYSRGVVHYLFGLRNLSSVFFEIVKSWRKCI